MNTSKRGSTSEMQVTSIRLEPELKEQLREISGEQGYQTLIREVLWQFVKQQMMSDEVSWRSLSNGEPYSVEDRGFYSHSPQLSMSDVRVTFRAIAQQKERCAITDQLIEPQQPMWLGLTIAGELVPIKLSEQG